MKPEKLIEVLSVAEWLKDAVRHSYTSGHALVGVIEEAMGIELSDRIRYIRTIMDELQRIDSHLLYLGCMQNKTLSRRCRFNRRGL